MKSQLTLILSLLTFGLFFATTLQAQTVNGRNVTAVTYNGSETGSFKQISETTWAEYKGSSKQVHDTFTEDSRDDWSVYLTKSDGAKIQIDLHTKQMYYNRQFLFNIARSGARPLVVNGYNVTFVTYSGSQQGSFAQTGDKVWTEYLQGSSQAHDTFREDNRDEWSVYLTKSNGAKVRIDLHTKQMYYNENFLFNVASSRAKPLPVNGRNVTAVTYSGTETGSFVQTGPRTWAEYKSGNPQPHDTFTEDNRDDWSVYLTKSNGAKIQIDLHTKKMYYNRNFLFNVSSASLTRKF